MIDATSLLICFMARVGIVNRKDWLCREEGTACIPPKKRNAHATIMAKGVPAELLAEGLVALANWGVLQFGWAGVFACWADNPVVSLLLHDVCCPPNHAAHRKNWCVQVNRDTHHVVSRS